MFKATCIYHRDPFHPHRGREVRELTGPAQIKHLAPKTKQPFIILRNGEAVLRADWDQVISTGDLLSIVLLPQGGGDDGGSNVLQVILMIVVAVLSFYTGGAVGAAYGAGYGAAAQAAVGIVGAVLVNALVPPPKPQGLNSQAGGDSVAASPTYNIAAQGNAARLEGAIPIQYGRMVIYPDFAAAPYVEYAGNEQYLYQLFCIGVGRFDVGQIRIEDTAIENFEEVQYEIVGPGEVLDLFPSAVTTSVEVSGQEALTGVEIGPFVANAAGTLTTRIAVDLVFPRGLYLAEDNGSLSPKTVNLTISARKVDDDGSPIGAWVALASEAIAAATATPLRYSLSYSLASGRYEVKLVRTDTKDTSTRAGHELVWAGLRAYLQDARTFGDVTLLAVKIRATNNISQQSSRKINVDCTRKLYQWTGSAWAGEYSTRSIAWALADACKTVGLPDSRIDLDKLLELDETWTARGDTFNGRFDSTTTFWEAITKIAQAGRCKAFMQGGVMCFVRDQEVSLPVALFSMRNIIRGSFSLNFITPSEDTADSVEVSYFDDTTWKPRRLTCALPASSALKPAKVSLFGVTNRAQANREGTYMAAANRYRRTLIKFATEMDGFIPSYGDLVAINHDMPQWGQFAEVVAWDAGALTMTLSEPMTWGSGTHYVGLRRRDGSVSGPYVVTAGDSVYKLVLAETPDITPYVGSEEERTHITFGWGDTWAQLGRIVSIKPRDEYTVDVVCVNEDPNVHSADIGIFAPPVSSSQLPTPQSAPALIGLSARSMPGAPDQMLLTWQPSPGAEYYIVEQSADGLSWNRTGETRASNYTAISLYGSQTIVRVAAIGTLRGAYATLNYALEADYMWASDSGTLMWSTDSNLMWRY
jgi:sulfur carrier protein ThiS